MEYIQICSVKFLSSHPRDITYGDNGMSKVLYKLLVSILILLFLVAPLSPLLGPVASIAKASSQPKCVRLAVAEEISSLNPLVGNSLVDWFIFNLIYDKLAIYSTNLTPMPWLAKSWEIKPDHKTWILHLVRNATWQDGVPFTADDVVFTINYIKQHKEIWLWQDEVQYIESVKKLDDYTVEIKTSIPVANLPWYVFPRLPILPKHIWEKITNPTKYPNTKPVGNGPFILEEYKPGEYIKFVANPHYWRGKPKVDCIIAKIGLTPDTAFLELKKGELDIMVLSPEYVKEAEKDPKIKVVISPDIYFDYVVLNTKKYPFNITEFRHAIAYAINKQDLVNRVLLGYGEPLYSVIPPAYKVWHNPNVPKYKYNPKKAKEILDKLGFVDRNGDGIRDLPNGKPLKIELLTLSTWPPYVRMADLLKKYLRDVGIDVKIVAVDWGEESQRLHNRNYEMAIWGFTVAPDPSQFLSMFLSTAKPWWSMGEWSNKTFDKLYKEQLSEFNLTKRRMIIWKMQEILAEQLPIIPIWVDYVIEAYRIDTFTGWIPMPMGILGIYNKLTWLSVHPVVSTTTKTLVEKETVTKTSVTTKVTATPSPVVSTVKTVQTQTKTSVTTIVKEKSVVPGWVYATVIVAVIVIAAAVYIALRRR